MNASENFCFFYAIGTDPFVTPVTKLRNIFIILFYFIYLFHIFNWNWRFKQDWALGSKIFHSIAKINKKIFLSTQCWLGRCGRYLMNCFGLNVVIIKNMFSYFFPGKESLNHFKEFDDWQCPRMPLDNSTQLNLFWILFCFHSKLYSNAMLIL